MNWRLVAVAAAQMSKPEAKLNLIWLFLLKLMIRKGRRIRK